MSRGSRPDWLGGLPSIEVYPNSSRAADDDGGRQLIPPGALGSSSSHGLGLGLGHGAPTAGTIAAISGRKPRLSTQALLEVRAFFLDTKLNLLLVAFPFAVISKAAGWGDGPTFVLSMLALCPLAERLGFVTEQLAMYTNDTLGGLLNASFGNATEVIISGFALQHGFLRVVQLSLLGSVVSNLLLVMGSAFIAGGVRHSVQCFNKQGVNVNCALLFLGTLAILLPSLLDETHSAVTERSSELALSRFESLLLLAIYAAYLVFQLWTHRHLYDEVGSKKSDASVAGAKEKEEEGVDMEAQETPLKGPQDSAGGTVDTPTHVGGHTAALLRTSSARHANGGQPGGALEMSALPHGEGGLGSTGGGGYGSRASSGRPPREIPTAGPTGDGAETRSRLLRDAAASISNGAVHGGRSSTAAEQDEDDDEEELVLSKVGCFLWLAAVTVVIALLSEWIMDAIKGASVSLGVPMPFLVTIILPIVGNAAEHASAIVFAYKNRMEIALGVAVGSSTQVSVLVVPFCVVLAWMMGQPLDLNFNAFESAVLFLSVLLAIITLQDGTGNWLKGSLLLVTYIFVSAGFWLHKDSTLSLADVDGAR